MCVRVFLAVSCISSIIIIIIIYLQYSGSLLLASPGRPFDLQHISVQCIRRQQGKTGKRGRVPRRLRLEPSTNSRNDMIRLV